MSEKTPLNFSIGTETDSTGEFRLSTEDISPVKGNVYFAKDADSNKSQGRIYYDDETGKRYVVTSFSAIYDDKSHNISNYYVTKPILTTNYTEGKYYFTFTNGNGSANDYHLTDIYIDGWTWEDGVTAGPKAEIKRKKNGVDYDTIEVAAIPHATTTRSGVITAADQTFKGIKTFQTQVKCGTGDANTIVLDVQGNANINYGLGFQSNAAKFLYDSTSKTLTLSFQENDGKFIVEDDTNIKESLTVMGNTILGSQSTNTVIINGPTTLKSTLTTSGATSLASTLSVGDDTSLAAKLEVDGATFLNNTLTVAEATILSKTLGVSGNTTIGGTLNVAGATTLGSNLTITGNIVPSTSITYNLGSTSYPWLNIYASNIKATLSDGTEGASLYTNASTTITTATGSYLVLGNSTASGTAKNRYGVLRIYGQKSGYTDISADTTITSGYTLYLPAASGQIVYHTNDTQIGGSSTPVYVASSGQITACSQPVSGSWFQGVPCVTSGGVIEIGRYIDFHSTSATTSDFSIRIDAGAGNAQNILYLPDISGQVVVHNNDTQVGSGIKPVYVSASGNITESASTIGSGTAPVYLNGGTITQGSTYAGGTKVTLNGTDCGASTASFYAPTSVGTSGYILKSNGSGAPSWAAVTNKGATLAWNTTSTIATIAGTDIKVTMPANPDTNTHHTAYLYATSSSGTSNASTTNDNTYLRLIENGSARSSLKITGSGATSVTSNTSGTITISSTNTTYSNATTSAAGLMSASDKSKLNGITSSADSVSFSRSLTSGTKIGTLTINGTATDLYCQTDTNTNTNYYHSRVYSSGLKISTGTGVSDMYVPNATTNQAGVVSTAAQSFAGTKTFTANTTHYNTLLESTNSIAYWGNPTLNMGLSAISLYIAGEDNSGVVSLGSANRRWKNIYMTGALVGSGFSGPSLPSSGVKGQIFFKVG